MNLDWLRRLRNRMTWRRAKQEIILWLANGEPYVVNTSVQLPAQQISIGHASFIGKPDGHPFLTVGDVKPSVGGVIALGEGWGGPSIEGVEVQQ